MEEFIFWTFELMNPYPEGWATPTGQAEGTEAARRQSIPALPSESKPGTLFFLD